MHRLPFSGWRKGWCLISTSATKWYWKDFSSELAFSRNTQYDEDVNTGDSCHCLFDHNCTLTLIAFDGMEVNGSLAQTVALPILCY